MSDNPRFDVALDAVLNSGVDISPDVADSIVTHVFAALYAFDSTHSSDRSLGVRRWDVMAHESRLRQQFEREIRSLPMANYSGPVEDRYAIWRDDVLAIVKGPISG